MRIDIDIEEIAACFYVHGIHTLKIFYHATPEAVPVLPVVLCPARLCQGDGTGECLIVTTFITLHVFVPYITLHTDDMFCHQFVSVIGNRIITIGLFQCLISADGSRGGFGFFLILVQVSIRAGSHNCVVSRFGGSDTAFHTTPGHHSCIGCESAFQDFIPTDDIPSFAVEIFLHAGDEVALQLFFLCMFLTVNGIRSGIIFQT